MSFSTVGFYVGHAHILPAVVFPHLVPSPIILPPSAYQHAYLTFVIYALVRILPDSPQQKILPVTSYFQPHHQLVGAQYYHTCAVDCCMYIYISVCMYTPKCSE